MPQNHKTMNILFVSNNPFNPIVGGLERVTDVLTRELQSRGNQVFYLCSKIGPQNSSLLDYEFPAKLYQLPNEGNFDDLENASFYSHLQTELKIDIVINQRGLGGELNNILLLTKVKIISVIHSTPNANVVIGLGKLIQNTTPPLVSIKRCIKKLFSPIVSHYWERVYRREQHSKYKELACYSDVVVTLSRVDAKMLDKECGISRLTNVVSIPNPNAFSISHSSLGNKKKIILYVGRLSKSEKAPIRLLQIWKYLYKNYSQWKLKIVGDGEEMGAMQSYIEQHRLLNVSLEGSSIDVEQYYKEASFICLTSNVEGWGMALTEGMQYGCIPCTFNNYGAAFDIIDDDVNGCLIPAFDLKEYAKRLAELMSNDAKRFKMSKAAIEKVKDFSVENVADKWEKLFMNL